MAKSAKALKNQRLNWINDNALRIFEERYYDKASGEKCPQDVFKRVSAGNKEFYDLMNDGLFLPNSPTLFNAGLNNGGTLSACFVFDIDDCLLGDWPDGGKNSPFPNSILGTTFKASCVAKAGGGVGYYLGNIRAQGKEVKSTHKKACGPVGVLKWLNGIRGLITQGGKRDLAQMAVLNADHEDVFKFIHCKDEDPQALGSFNISLSYKDEMMKSIKWDILDHMLTTGDTDPMLGQRTAMTSVFMEQCQSAWKTGDPGVLFYDAINRANATPHLGNIYATNPCGETPNLNNEPCNLGSLVLYRFLKKSLKGWVMDWPALASAVKRATRFLDAILDMNVFPHPDITKAAQATRKLGLGVMGYADALALMKIPYDTKDAVDFGEQVMQYTQTVAKQESYNMAQTKGPYKAWNKKLSPAWATKSRNSTNTSIAPTGTIAILAGGVSSSIEPHFALQWDRTTHEGIKLQEKIAVADQLDGFVPKVANEIDPKWHILHMAAFQEHTCLGVSKTINMPNSATVKDIADAYKMMWETGCKGGTIFRDGCRSEQVLVDTSKQKTKSVYMTKEVKTGPFGMSPEDLATMKKQIEEYSTNLKRELIPSGSMKKGVPNDCQTIAHRAKIGGTKIFLHIGVLPSNEPIEIFLRASKTGSTVSGMMDAWAMSVSMALQAGVSLQDLISMYKGVKFEPSGLVVNGHPDIKTCTSIPDYIVRYMELHFRKPDPTLFNLVDVVNLPIQHSGFTLPVPVQAGMMVYGSGQMCPDCGSELVRYGASCLACTCGYSKC